MHRLNQILPYIYDPAGTALNPTPKLNNLQIQVIQSIIVSTTSDNNS